MDSTKIFKVYELTNNTDDSFIITINNIKYITAPSFSENNGNHKPKTECLNVELKNKEVRILVKNLYQNTLSASLKTAWTNMILWFLKMFEYQRLL